jgi:peptide/nickel transport system substrate-binding protein
MSKKTVSRREFVEYSGKSAVVASTLGLAGCLSSSGDDGDGETVSGTEAENEESSDSESATSVGQTTSTEDFPVDITLSSMPSGLDPHDHLEIPTETVLLHVYEGLLTRSPDGGIQSNLATGYERVENGHIQFTIREDVQFHNGDDLTPADIVYSINRIVKPDVGPESPQKPQLAGITKASAEEDVSTVDVFSNGLNPVVFQELASWGDIMQKSWTEKKSDTEINQQMNGTGPFQLASYTEDEEVVMVRNENFWDNPAEVSKLTFSAAAESSTRVNQLVAEETDLIVNVPSQDVNRVRNTESSRVESAPSIRIMHSAMQYDVEPFTDVRFRRAMNHAIDLESIVKNVLDGFGEQTGQPTLEGFVGHNSNIDPYPYDPDRAEQLVEESGFAGAEIELHTPVGRYLKDLEIAQAVAGYIDELENVSTTINQREYGVLIEEVLRDSEDKPSWYLLGYGESTFDGGLLINALLTADGATSTFSNPKVEQLMKQAGQQQGDQRDATLQQANQRLHNLAPWIFLNRQYSIYGVSNRIDWSARRDERIDAYSMSSSN